MTRPEKKRIPDHLWKGMVQHGITPSLNLVIDDGAGEILFLLRANEPMKGRLWVPGGRMRNAETKEHAVHRLAREELGLEPEDYEVLHVSDRHNEEIFHIHEMDEEHAKARYGDDIKSVHYWGGVVLLRLKSGAKGKIILDEQSEAYQWLKEIPENPHDYLLWYFRVLRDAGFSALKLPEDV